MNWPEAKSGLRTKVGLLLAKATPVSSTATRAPRPWAAPRFFSVSQAARALMPPRASKARGAGAWPQSEPHGRKFHCVRRQSPAAENSPGRSAPPRRGRCSSAGRRRPRAARAAPPRPRRLRPGRSSTSFVLPLSSPTMTSPGTYTGAAAASGPEPEGRMPRSRQGRAGLSRSAFASGGPACLQVRRPGLNRSTTSNTIDG